MATTSSSTVKNNLIYFKKKLERSTDEEEVVHIIHKLSKIPMSIDLLKGTGAGKIIRVLAKKPGRVGHKASSLLKKWREIMVTSEKAEENFKDDKLTSSAKESIKDAKHSRESERHSKEKHSKDKHFIEKHSKENISKEKEKHTKDKQNKEKYSKEYIKEKHVKSSHKEKNLNLKNSLSKLNKKSEVSSKHILQKNPVTVTKMHENISKQSKHILEKNPVTVTVLEDEFIDFENSNVEHYSYDYDREFEGNDKISAEISREICQNLDESIMSSSPSKHHNNHSKSAKVKKISSHLIDNKKLNKTDSHSYKNESLNKEKHRKNNDVKESKTDNLTVKKNKVTSSSSIKKESKKALKIVPTEEFTASEATFEDCLSFNDIVPVKKRKNTNKLPANPTSKKMKDSCKIKTIEKVKNCSEPVKISKISNNQILDQKMFEAIEEKLNLKKEVDILSTLPQTQPNYRPLPQRSYDSIPVKKKAMTNEDAIKFTSSRREKTAVYSGRKNCYLTEVPSLFECCTRILIENIDDIEYMGEIPYFLLESMLQRCTAQQLYRIEHYNPYLLEDTNELWEKHCKRDYRNSAPQENETWRELYSRSQEEQETRLRNVTANISASIANSNPVRKAKLAYIDAFVKPPRDVARRQAKNGTALATSHSVKVPSPSPLKASPKAAAVAGAPVPVVSSASTSKPRVELKPQKPKVAPLMAKTLKSMKQCFRR